MKLTGFPPGLSSLYKRMMQQICNLDDIDDANICKRLLALITIVYQPIALEELTSLIDMHEEMADNLKSLQEIIALCGSFLTIRRGTVYFVHQSAKDFLVTESSSDICFRLGRKKSTMQSSQDRSKSCLRRSDEICTAWVR